MTRHERRTRRPTATLPPHRAADPVLPLTVSQANRLRGLVRSELADLGVVATVHAEHASDQHGREFGLWNLAADCRMRPEREWAPMVRERFETLLMPQTPEDLTDDELAEGVHWRLIHRGQVPDAHPRALAVGDDLLALLSVRTGRRITTPPEDLWHERGGLEHWTEIGRDNLLRTALSPELVHRHVPGPAGGFELVESDLFFTASTALVSEWLVRRFTPEAEAACGLLVVVPHRLQLAWRPLDEPPSPATRVDDLARFAQRARHSGPGPLSRRVYWKQGDQWEQLTA